jgi:hypothetical protein
MTDLAESQDVKRDKLEKLLRQFQRYYTIDRETPLEPFDAQAEFSAHGEQYFLMKSAIYAQMDSREFVYFYLTGELNEEEFAKIDAAAWNDGLSKADPKENHRNSDVVLYIIADIIKPEAQKLIRKARHFKNYKFGLHGFSNYRLVTIEVSSGRKITNYQGKPLLRLLSDI